MHWNSNEWCVWGGDVRFCIVPTSKPLATPDMQGKIWKWSLNMYSLVQAWKDWIALTCSFIIFTNTLPIRTEVAVLFHLMHRLFPQPLVCNSNNTRQPPSTILSFTTSPSLLQHTTMPQNNALQEFFFFSFQNVGWLWLADSKSMHGPYIAPVVDLVS